MGLRQRLNLARLYVCTDLRAGRDDLLSFAEEVFSGGADVVQICDRAASPVEVAEATAALRGIAPARSLVVTADSSEVDVLGGADMVHTEREPAKIRGMVPHHALVGCGAATAEQVDRAVADPDTDYFLVGPADGATGAGPTVALDLVAHAAQVAPPHAAKPWFVIGGVNEDNLGTVVGVGAHRVVVGSAVARAEDPRAVVESMRARLNEAWVSGRSAAERMRDAWIPGTER